MAWHPTWNEPPQHRQQFFYRITGGRGPSALKVILLVTIAVFALQVLGYHKPLTEWGSLSVEKLLQGQVWRLLTYQVLHGDLWRHLFWNMFILWMFGSTIEAQLGRKQFAWLYIMCGVVGGITQCLFNLAMHAKYGVVHYQTMSGIHQTDFLGSPAIGASAGVMGILIAFATINPRATVWLMFLFPVRVKWVAIVYFAVETLPLLQAFQGVQGMLHMEAGHVAHAAHFGGAVLGFLWIKFGGRVAAWRELGLARRVWQSQQRTESTDREEMDRILQKIHDEGIDSLTMAEKMFLQRMSRPDYRDDDDR